MLPIREITAVGRKVVLIENQVNVYKMKFQIVFSRTDVYENSVP